MAEERTVSNFTRINTAFRARQKPGTIVKLTQIRQHNKRIQARKNPSPPKIKPQLRWRDITEYTRPVAAVDPVPSSSGISSAPNHAAMPPLTVAEDAPEIEIPEIDLDLDTNDEDASWASQDIVQQQFTSPTLTVDGVDLHSSLLRDTLSATPVEAPGRSATPATSVSNAQQPEKAAIQRKKANWKAGMKDMNAIQF